MRPKQRYYWMFYVCVLFGFFIGFGLYVVWDEILFWCDVWFYVLVIELTLRLVCWRIFISFYFVSILLRVIWYFNLVCVILSCVQVVPSLCVLFCVRFVSRSLFDNPCRYSVSGIRDILSKSIMISLVLRQSSENCLTRLLWLSWVFTEGFGWVHVFIVLNEGVRRFFPFFFDYVVIWNVLIWFV